MICHFHRGENKITRKFINLFGVTANSDSIRILNPGSLAAEPTPLTNSPYLFFCIYITYIILAHIIIFCVGSLLHSIFTKYLLNSNLTQGTVVCWEYSTEKDRNAKWEEREFKKLNIKWTKWFKILITVTNTKIFCVVEDDWRGQIRLNGHGSPL